MGIEIEHKFLVVDSTCIADSIPTYIRQGYLSITPTVRIRIYGEKGFITVKSKADGNTRSEYEYEIPKTDAIEMLDNLCPQPQIEKNRYIVTHQGNSWEVDVFLGENQGLVLAELELQSQDEEFSRPEWVGRDVTLDFAYTNAQLTLKPFTTWVS